MTDPQSPAVTYSYSDWIAAFPEFAGCSAPQGQAFFNRATTMFANSITNPMYRAQGAAGFKTLMYTLVSHIAWLNAPRDANGTPSSTGSPASPIVGRINSASEGSVSVQADMGDATAGSPSQAWYMQSRYGAEFWQATATARSATYLANPLVMPDAYLPGFNSRRVLYRR